MPKTHACQIRSKENYKKFTHENHKMSRKDLRFDIKQLKLNALPNCVRQKENGIP